MECNKIQNKLIYFLENKLLEKESKLISKHLENCSDCQREANDMEHFLDMLSKNTQDIPSENLRLNFEDILASEKVSQQKVIKLKPEFNYKMVLKYAAGIALLISTFLFGRYQQVQRASGLDNEQTAILALMENESASKRIQGVQYIEEYKDPDPEIVEALVKRMLNDENTNVRLTAANALHAFIASESVKNGFIKALETEKDPAIQISIINSLVKIQEKKALKPMRKLLEQEETQSFVKDEIRTLLTNII